MEARAPGRSLKRNFLYSATYTLLNILFPILTFAYVSRILGPEVLGRIQFATALGAFFVVAAALAMPIYGAREIARHRDDRGRLDGLFSELFQVNFLSTAASAAVYAAVFLASDRMRGDWALFLMTGVSILVNALGVDWLYQGLENYRFIMWRGFVFKAISLGLIVALVHRPEDFLWVAAVSAFANVGNGLVGFLGSGRHVTLKLQPLARLKTHLLPMSVLSAGTLVGTMYVFLDSVLLGFLSGNRPVGLFGAATRVTRVAIAFLESLTAVIIPRFSYYLDRGQDREYRAMARKSLSLIYLLAFPAVGGLMVLAPRIIRVLSGAGFLEAVPAMRITAPMVLIMGFTNFLGLQIIFPNKGEKKLLAATLVGAVVDLALNLLLIPRFGQNGTAVAWLAAESCSLCVLVYLAGKNRLDFAFFDRVALRYLGAGLVSTALVLAVSRAIGPDLPAILSAGAAGAALYALLLWWSRDALALEMASVAGRQWSRYFTREGRP